jgi:hypothetical protein
MRNIRGRALAAGILCAIAATVAVWSGPLAAVSADLHAAAGAAASHPTASAHVAPAGSGSSSNVVN